MEWKIPLFKIFTDEEDVSSVTEIIRSGMHWANGQNIQDFEACIADFLNIKYCLSFNSGTTALFSELLAYGIGKGDEVIVPSFTFIATANSARFVGAKPVFADIEPETLGLDPSHLQENITKKTRAILPIHYGGCPCHIQEIRDIAEDKNILLIEDNAEALGAKIRNTKVGTFGDSAVLSFCQNKIITTGEGGAVVTDSRNLYEKLKLIRSHGRDESCNYFSTNIPMDYISLGYNFRISGITAALGLSQMKKIDTIIQQRRKSASYYRKKISQLIPECTFPRPPADYYHVYQLFSVLASKRDDLMKHLQERGIMTKIYFTPVHKTHYYRNILGYDSELPVTESISSNILSLPFYPGISPATIDFIVESIADFYGKVK